MHMNRLSWFLYCFIFFGLVACDDFFNRTYGYHEEIPLKPFVIKLTQTEYQAVGEKAALKIYLAITNKSSSENRLPRNRFILRIGLSREIIQNPTFLKTTETDTILFTPGKNTVVIVPFLLSKNDLKQKLTLIVDRQKKDGKERLALIDVKDSSPPKSIPKIGEWSTAHSPQWD